VACQRVQPASPLPTIEEALSEKIYFYIIFNIFIIITIIFIIMCGGGGSGFKYKNESLEQHFNVLRYNKMRSIKNVYVHPQHTPKVQLSFGCCPTTHFSCVFVVLCFPCALENL